MKRLVKSLILRFLATVSRDDCGKVIFYHDVGTAYTRMGTAFDMFRGHVSIAIANGYRYVENVEKLSGRDGEKALMLCFDDGFRGIWDVREYFKMMNLHPTVFIAVDLVGRAGYLTWDEILTLQSEYGFRFESHTWSHQTLAGAYIDESPKAERTNEWFNHELKDSKLILSERLGRPVTQVCFPAGYFTDNVVERCKTAGYERMFASYPGASCDRCVVPRHLVQSANIKDFISILRGALIPLKNFYLKQHRESVVQKCESCT